MNPESHDKCPIRDKQEIFNRCKKTQTHRGGGDVKTEAEMGVMWPQTKECPAIRSWKGQGTESLELLE